MSAGLRVGRGQCGDLYRPDNAKASSVNSGSDGMPNVTAFDSSSFRQLAQSIDLLFITLICHDPVAVQSGVRSIFRFSTGPQIGRRFLRTAQGEPAAQ